jgi:type III secretory pathway component EscV
VHLAERVRHALSGQITAKFTQGRASLAALRLDSEIEFLISSAIQQGDLGSHLALDPRITENILGAVRDQVNALGAAVDGVPILVLDSNVRRFVRNLVSLEFPWLHVLSRQDIEPNTPIQEIDLIRLNPVSPTAPGVSA